MSLHLRALPRSLAVVAMESITEIDGAIMEGGGQILRMATSLGALLGKPVCVRNIRAGRSTPGLRPQHLTGLQLIRDICGGRLEGGQIGSTVITFYPAPIKSGRFIADTGTAGSICLILQLAIPCMIYGNGRSSILLKGGTDVESAPPIDHYLWVFRPIAEKFGIKFECDIRKRGYYPKGGGEVFVRTNPIAGTLLPIEMVECGQITQITGRSFVAGVLPIKVAHTMADAACKSLKQTFPRINVKVDRVKEAQEKAIGTGSGIILVAETSNNYKLGSSALGKRGVPAEQVGEAAAMDLIRNINEGGCVDSHLQDQLILLMTLAKGKSKIRCGKLTLHTETAIHVAELLTSAKFSVIPDEGKESCVIECQGIGLQKKS
ncbi:RNA 3'-terminal phosphate cyclase isoform X2 [Centruroides vittatus]|uniref:RNA 3'-terminal phosphate cyclase isoform X2 n=1 Tax=Centruroides vittatus TaxID=120091 RepID=UPI00350EC74E